MDEPCYSTNAIEWRAWRAQKVISEWGVVLGQALDLDALTRLITEAMDDEITQYQRDHAYEHWGADA